jgi:lipoyl synthase
MITDDPMSWHEIVSNLEAFEDFDLEFDAGLVSRFEQAAQVRPLQQIRMHTPTFRSYAGDEIQGCGKNSFPAFSITGPACALNCDHCQAKILEPMIPATSPDELDRRVRDLIMLQDLKGFLLSGGSNKRNEVPYDRYYGTVEKLKRDFPYLKIAMHSALLDEGKAKAMESAGVDVAMTDVIGHQDTIRDVYHLNRSVDDFEETLRALRTTTMSVVPHIVIGLHYGRILGEFNALDIIARHNPDSLVLVVVMPFYAPKEKPFATVTPGEVGEIFLAARQRLADRPVQLGCARPAGIHKMITDTYATMAGLDGIAFPANGIVSLAHAIGRPVDQQHACCSMVVGGAAGDITCAA